MKHYQKRNNMKKFSKKQKNFILIFLSLCVLMAGVVLGWYAVSSLVSANNVSMQVDSVDSLIVKVLVENGDTKEKVLLSEVVGDGKKIDIGLADLTNIEEGKIAPGAFGEIHFFITATSPYYSGCQMEIEPSYKFVDNITNLTNTVTPDELKQIVDSHILYFTDKYTDDTTNEIRYSGKLTFDNDSSILTINRNLTLNNEEEIVLYWYWPYDYNEILPYIDENSIISQDGSKEENVRQYDTNDTLIGNYLESITLSFEIKGTQSN